ncbi:MAG TPA: VOC family protein [Candidatus Binatus sp.]|nr:VOC family protein [Candidatus Binatus sp.]
MSADTQTKTKPSTIIGLDIMAFQTQNPQRLIAFYRDVLGLQPTEVDEEGRGAEFTLADGSTFGVWKPDDGDSSPAVMFAVPDIKAAVAEFRARGAELSDHLETGVCYMSFGEDPDGNAFVIHQRKNRD